MMFNFFEKRKQKKHEQKALQLSAIYFEDQTEENYAVFIDYVGKHKVNMSIGLLTGGAS